MTENLQGRRMVTEPVEVKKHKKEEKVKKLITSVVPHRGHTCYEYNTKLQTLEKAQFDVQTVDYGLAQKSDYSPTRQVTVKEDCVYATSLNKKNAIKRFERLLNRKIVIV